MRCNAEAVVQRCSVKKMFLEIPQNSQENTCARVSFLIKLQAEAQVFSCEFCEISKITFFDRTPLMSASHSSSYPADIYLLKVNNRSTRTRCEVCSKLIKKIPERRHWRRSGIFIASFEHISHLALVFLLLTLNM